MPENYRMIALSSTIGKLLHLILADRMSKFLVQNNFIDPKLQKGFLSGINGCIENNICLEELILHARQNHKTLHCTFVDLQDAFGSVPHALIKHTMERTYLPANVQSYITSIYTNSKSVVRTKHWQSEHFSFKRGVAQGDPLSPIIFIMIFHPILMYLEEKKSLGYPMDDTLFSGLAYADDFTIITRNKRSHQKLLHDINDKITQMGLKIKPAKCRSLSICAGKPTSIIFDVASSKIPSIETDEQKFLGQRLFFTNKEKDKVEYMYKILQEKLQNIDKTPIRSEYKVIIYARYLLPSLRFILTVHSFTKSSLEHLDNMTEKLLKKWTGLPPCATRVIVHYKKTLAIPTIADVYKESHSKAYASTWIKGDSRTTAAMNNKLSRDLQSKKPLKLAAFANSVVSGALMEEGLPDTTETLEVAMQEKVLRRCKKTIQQEVDLLNKANATEKINSYEKQGDLLRLVADMDKDISWKSYIYNLPKGTMKFILNASINTLPTLSNLKQWGKSSSDKCPHCAQKETTFHILNGCKIFLDQGRYTWRHDCLVNYLYKIAKNSDFEVYADLKGKNTSGGTIPADILVTAERPDLVLINRSEKLIYMYELTVPYETRLDKAHNLKSEKYDSLGTDLVNLGWRVIYYPFEVGSRGLIPQSTKDSLYKLLKLTQEDITPKTLYSLSSKLITVCSYKLFIARRDTEWSSPEYLMP